MLPIRKALPQAGKRLAAVLLALVLTLAMALRAPTAARADSPKDRYQQSQKKLQDIRDQQKALEQTQSSRRQQRALQEQEKETLLEQIALLNEQIEQIGREIDALIEQIIAKQAEIEQKQAEFDERWAGFKERMAAMQMMDDGGTISILSSVTNLYELLTFTQTLEDIATRDEQICQDLEAQRVELEAQRAELERERLDLRDKEAELEAQYDEMEAKRQELANSIQALDSKISAGEAQAQALEASEDEAEKEFEKAAEEYRAYLDAQNDKYADPSMKTSLDFGIPIKSYTRITNGYGSMGTNNWRTHPHGGSDIAAPAWTPIYAAADGRVTAATRHSSYGNYVQILHGVADDGKSYSTLYAHMVQPASVKEGDIVLKGEIIGYVGSTGHSTGPHLHLELRINGSRTNPLNYIPLPRK